jgi:hypothetical protein
MMVSAGRGSALGRLGGPAALVQLTSEGPFSVASVMWRDGRGHLFCTVVAKATYELGPGVCTPVPDPLAILADDATWGNDPARSVQAPADLAPFKMTAEVVLVGSAFATDDRAVPSLTARLVVGSVDKALTAWAPRWFRSDGAVEAAAGLTRFPLRWESAAGGPETDNPAGVDPIRADLRGRRAIPRLLPAAYELGRPGDYVPIVGFGPIAPGWPTRLKALGEQDRAWLQAPLDKPLPQSFPPRFFQAAPRDQWLDRALAANERIVLEGMHDGVPRLVTSLSGIEPWAMLSGPREDAVRLTGDLLVIDTDRSLATLTFRAQLAVDEGAAPLRVAIAGVAMGTRPALERRPLPEPGGGPRPAHTLAGVGDIDDPGTADSPRSAQLEDDQEELDMGKTSVELPAQGRGSALPFAQRSAPQDPSSRGSFGGSALPFRDRAPAVPRSPPRSVPAPPPPVSVRAPSAPPPAPLPLAPPPPAMVAAAPAPAPTLPAWQPREPAPTAPSAFIPPREASSPPRPEPAAPGPTRLFPSLRAEPAAPAGGVRALSDAAADRENRRDAGLAPAAVRPAGELRRLAVVDLLSFDPRLAPRLRAMKRFAAVWAQAPKARPAHGVDEPRAEPPDRARADVLRVLSCARADAAVAVRNALAESLDDLADLEPPLVLVSGELRPIFDEVETLRAAVSIAQAVAGGDKKLLASIALGQEALAAPYAPRPEAVLGLSRQLEQATAQLSLPPRYLASQVERALLENRKYKRRTLLGEARVRADLTLAQGGDTWALYLPDSISASLPLLPSYPVVALCEVRPREDLGEAQPEALFTVALGRVLHSRAEG